MELYYFTDGKFEEKEYALFFEHEWLEGEFEDSFLDKNKFYHYDKVLDGAISIFKMDSEEAFYVTFSNNFYSHAFFTSSFPELILLLKFLGINYLDHVQQPYRRVIEQYELKNTVAVLSWEIVSVVPLDGGLAFVTARRQIDTHDERQRIAAEIKKEREKAKQKENLQKIS